MLLTEFLEICNNYLDHSIAVKKDGNIWYIGSIILDSYGFSLLTLDEEPSSLWTTFLIDYISVNFDTNEVITVYIYDEEEYYYIESFDIEIEKGQNNMGLLYFNLGKKLGESK